MSSCLQCNLATALRIDENNQPNLFGKYVRCPHCGSVWEPFWWVPEEQRDEYQRTHYFNQQTNRWEVQ